MQSLEFGTWIDAELVGQDAPHDLVGGQGVGLPAGAVQAQHQLGVELLLQRVVRDQLAQFRHDLTVPPHMQIGVDPRRQRMQPLVGKVGNLTVAQDLGGHVRERFPAPPPERLAQQAGRLGPGPGLRGRMAPGGQRAELADIQPGVVDPDQVPGRPGLDQAGAGGAQRRAQPLNRAVQCAPRPRRCLALPQRPGEGVQADHAPGAQQQRRQEDALPGRRHGDLARAVPHPQRPEQPELHG